MSLSQISTDYWRYSNLLQYRSLILHSNLDEEINFIFNINEQVCALVGALDELYVARNTRPGIDDFFRVWHSTQVRHISTAANYIKRARNDVVTRNVNFVMRDKINYEQVEREIVWWIAFGRPNRDRNA